AGEPRGLARRHRGGRTVPRPPARRAAEDHARDPRPERDRDRGPAQRGPGAPGERRRERVKVILRHRHHGLHENVKEAVLPGTFGDYAVPKDEEFSTPDDWRIDEEKLIAALPEGFLPVPPYRILLAVEDEYGGTGQVGLSRFRNWAKYFDAYCLSLMKTEEPEKESSAEAAQAVSKAWGKLKPVIGGVKRDAEMMAAVHAAI